MQLVYDYLELRLAFKDVPDDTDIKITIPELSSLLFCSPRNAKLIIYKLKDLKWIAFTPGGGRGRVSTIQFRIPREDLILSEAKKLSLQGDLAAAFHLIRKYGEGLEVKGRFMGWFSSYVQFSIETNQDQQIEKLLIPVYAPLHSLDPAQAFYSFDSHIVKQVFNTLVSYDSIQDQFNEGLAHAWEQNEDGTQWLFYLRKGVYFHNNKEFISDDVVYTFQRYIREETRSPQDWMFIDLIAVESVGRYAVRFILKQPNVLFLRILSFIASSILSSESYQNKTTQTFIPIGTGPYKVVEYSKECCVLQAYSSYYQGRPHIDLIEVRAVAIQKHADTNASNYTPSSALSKEPIVSIEGEDLIAGSSFLTFNLNVEGPHSNELFREAFGYLLDRRKMIEELGETRVIPSSGFRYNPKSAPYSTPDIQKALELLNQMNYQGEPFHICTSIRHRKDAYWIQNWMSRYGIRIEISIVESKDLEQYRHTVQNSHSVLAEVILSDEELSMIELYQYSNSILRWHLNPIALKKVDTKIKEVLVEPSRKQRRKYLDQIESYLNRKHLIQFLVHKRAVEQNTLEIRGIESIQKGFIEFKDLWIQQISNTNL